MKSLYEQEGYEVNAIRLSPDQVEAVEKITGWFAKVRRPVEFCTGGSTSGYGGSGHGEWDGMQDGEDEDEGTCPATPHTHVVGIQGDAPAISLGGLAGTGKTSVMRHLGDALHAMGVKVLYGTPTHKAAGVLRGKLDGEAAKKVNTFYSLIYIPDPKHRCADSNRYVKEIPTACTCGNEEGECTCPKVFEPCGGHGMSVCTVREHLDWIRRTYMKGHTEILIVDESSMLSQDQVDDLRQFGIPLVLVGDHGQLPPVNGAMNRWIAKPDIVLTENHRQKNDTSGIVDLALWARQGIQLRKGVWGDGRTVVLDKSDERIGALLDVDRYRARNADASQWPQVICATNALRAGINRRFHGQGGVRTGDRVICLRRCEVPVIERITPSGTAVVAMHTVKVVDPDTGAVVEQDGPVERTVHNGATGTVVRALEPRGGHLSMIVRLDAGDVDGEMVQVDRCAERQFGAEKVLGDQERARDARLWDYAYAITCHKCADESTLILTSTGWRNNRELREGDLVLTLNPDTQMSEWQPVQAVHRYDVVNEPLLSIEAESHSSLTTLNHRWAVRGHKNRTTWKTSHQLFDRPSGYHGIFKAAEHHGFPKTAVHSDAFVELVAWFWTEGSIHANQYGPMGAVKISQSITANPEKTASIRAALLSEFGPSRKLGRGTNSEPGWNESVRTMTQSASVGGRSYPERSFDYAVFSLNNAAGSMLQKCAPNKTVAPEFILSLTREQLDLFIGISVLGDGTTDGKHRSIRQASRERLEAFQFACTLAGYSTVIRKSGDTWTFRLKTGRILNVRPNNWASAMSVVPYTGTVWCPQTANGTWFAKRNETTYFTGNSQGSEWDEVIVLDDAWTDKDRWRYTAATRARSKLVVVSMKD